MSQQPTPMVILQPQQGVSAVDRGEIPPARVRVALEFLGLLTFKQATRAIANDMAIETIPGQKLCSTEELARDEAHELLTRYFMGTLKDTASEQVEIERRKPEEYKNGVLHRCPVCEQRGRASPNCTMCKGQGMVVTFPVDEGGQ